MSTTGMPPVIDMLSAQVGSGNNVQIQGHVSGMNPNFQVALSGVVSGGVSTDSYGDFSYTGQAVSLGTEYAVATDSQGLSSTQVSTLVINNPPQVVGFQIVPTGIGKQVELSGSVADESPAGLAVNFSGGSISLGVSSATTDANGNFDLITTADALGSVDATVTDVWGAQSMQVQATLSVPPPQIVAFSYDNLGGGNYQFQGSVMDQEISGVNVQLSGMASENIALTSESFVSQVYALGTNASGTEYAIATDVWGQTSNVAELQLG